MFALLRRTRATTAGRRGRVVLRLEGMEGRFAPSGETVPALNPPIGGGTTAPANQAPRVSVSVESIGGGWYVVSGRVTDESPGGLTVTFGGNVNSLSGRTEMTAADGTFSFTVQLQTDGSDTGWLLATTKDNLGLASNEARCYVSPTGP